MPEQFDVSLILPCFNEAEHFNGSVDQIVDVLDRSDYSWEIIFIDDASGDQTQRLIASYIKRHPRKHLSTHFHETNRGRGASVADGVRRSQGRIVGYIDIDIEVSPHYIPRFVQAIEGGYDVATGWRIYDFTLRSFSRWVASKGYNVVRNAVLKTNLHDTEAGYKFFNKRSIIRLIDDIRSPGWFWDTEVMVFAQQRGLSIAQIPVVYIRRFDKTSTVRLIPDTLSYLKELWKFKRESHASS